MLTPFPRYRVLAPGVDINCTTTTAATTLPMSLNGTSPQYHRLMTRPSAAGVTTFCYVNVGAIAVTVGVTGLLVTSNEQVILQTRGCTTIAVLVPAQTCNLSVVPLEDC